MYLIALGPVVYDRIDGAPISLVRAVRETYGVGHARIIRASDGTTIVMDAGDAVRMLYRARTPAPDARMADHPWRPIVRRKVTPRRLWFVTTSDGGRFRVMRPARADAMPVTVWTGPRTAPIPHQTVTRDVYRPELERVPASFAY